MLNLAKINPTAMDVLIQDYAALSWYKKRAIPAQLSLVLKKYKKTQNFFKAVQDVCALFLKTSITQNSPVMLRFMESALMKVYALTAHAGLLTEAAAETNISSISTHFNLSSLNRALEHLKNAQLLTQANFEAVVTASQPETFALDLCEELQQNSIVAALQPEIEKYLQSPTTVMRPKIQFLIAQLLEGIKLSRGKVKKELIAKFQAALTQNNLDALLKCYAASLLFLAEHSSEENKAIAEFLEQQKQLAEANFTHLFYALSIYSQFSDTDTKSIAPILSNLSDPSTQKCQLDKLHAELIKKKFHYDDALCALFLINLGIGYNCASEFDALLNHALKTKKNRAVRLNFIVEKLSLLAKFAASDQEKLAILLKQMKSVLEEGSPEGKAFNKLAYLLRFESVKTQFEELLIYAHYINENKETSFSPHPFSLVLAELSKTNPDPTRFVAAVTAADYKVKNAMTAANKLNVDAAGLGLKYNSWLLLEPIENTDLLLESVVKLSFKKVEKNIKDRLIWAATKVENTLVSRTLPDILEAVACSNDENPWWLQLSDTEKENFKCKILQMLVAYLADLKLKIDQNLSLNLAFEIRKVILSKKSKKFSLTITEDLLQLIQEFGKHLVQEQAHLSIISTAMTYYNNWFKVTHFTQGLNADLESFLKNRVCYAGWPFNCINPLQIELMIAELRADLSIEMTNLFNDFSLPDTLLPLLNKSNTMDEAILNLCKYYTNSPQKKALQETLHNYPQLLSFCQYFDPQVSMDKSLSYYQQEAWLHNTLATLQHLDTSSQLSYFYGILMMEVRQAQIQLQEYGDATEAILSLQQDKIFLYYSQDKPGLTEGQPHWIFNANIEQHPEPTVRYNSNSNTTVIFRADKAPYYDSFGAAPKAGTI